MTVDVKFLEQISGWRQKLAINIVQNNPNIQSSELNFAVQMIIDRIVFLRICEDRGIEIEYRLEPLQNGARNYPRLLEIFQHADDRYNSGLFHFNYGKRRGAPDDITPHLVVSDRLIRDIISGLYGDKNPYVFSHLPSDILGQAYEQFLSKVIRISANTAEVEYKPEINKEHGVYYTPTYIVDYVVRETIGRLIDGKTPSQVSKIKVLDPACGSGSFLIGAYQFLLNWHLNYYTKNNPEKWKKGRSAAIFLFKKDPELGEIWRLTTAEKKRILLLNIHGVDIDTQAVEVTKLSLLLKVLEGESAEIIDNTLKLERERALPDLDNNIKCGNSLIGQDFFEQPQAAELKDNERYRINPFDWQAEFKEIMQDGGFDAIIGNPPWISLSASSVLVSTPPLKFLI